MKKIWIIILTAMNCLSLKAQVNLVPNWSFEDTVACPISIGQINRATGWSSYKFTPDYFNSCNNNQVSVPINSIGYQSAKTGNAYAGLYTYAKFSVNYREIVGVQLSQPLSIGQSYYISFYVNRAFNPNAGFHINIATNKLGLKLSTIPYSDTNPIQINNFAHIYSNTVINDSLNWIQISGFTYADSAYQYLGIGNFFTDANTTNIFFDTSAAFAYYFIDDVMVIDSNATGIIETGNNEIIKIFPIFFHDEMIIEGRGIKSVKIFDAAGKICIKKDCIVSPKKIDTKSLNKGMYFIVVTTQNEAYSKKIVKQ
ncbi:MAG: T9SS type A sorting domain-containing protein [Bacteroidia bacterium]